MLRALQPVSCILYSLCMLCKIISVTGAHSNIGKTTLCSILLQHLTGFGAIKFTRTPLFTSVIDDPDIISEQDKDTAVMSRSGAVKVVWLKSSGSGLEDALHIAMSKMDGLEGVIVEGNSPVHYMDPHLTIFIIGADGEVKASAGDVGQKADIIIINSPDHMGNPFSAPFPTRQNTRTFRIDLIKKEGEIDKFLAYTKKYIEGLRS